MEFQCGYTVFHSADMAPLKLMSVLVLVAVVGVFSFFSSTGFASLILLYNTSPLTYVPVNDCIQNACDLPQRLIRSDILHIYRVYYSTGRLSANLIQILLH